MSDDIDEPTVMVSSPYSRDGDLRPGSSDERFSPAAEAKSDTSSGQRRPSSSHKLGLEEPPGSMSRQNSLAAKALDRQAEEREAAAAAAVASSDAKVSDNNTTLSRNNPIAEFLKQNKGQLANLTQEEFQAKYEDYMSEHGARGAGGVTNGAGALAKMDDSPAEFLQQPKGSSIVSHGYLNFIVLKFTTLSEANEAASFTIGPKGAKIGRGTTNEVFVPSDTRLANVGHAFIEYSNGSFFLLDGGFDFGASIRISVGAKKKQWILENDARFSVGNSVFRSAGENEDGHLILDVLEGPLKGEQRFISRKGATLGRSSDNNLCIPDRELSRKHSRIEYDPALGKFFVCDIGSTNGTYMQLVGPYKGRYKLSLNDHILVGRTGFSVNRFDYGISEEMGHRSTMEDSCALVQHLNVLPLCNVFLAPQSFFGVYDGHGGSNTSVYLSQHLHANVVEALTDSAPELLGIIDEVTSAAGHESSEHSTHETMAYEKTKFDAIVRDALTLAFRKTDATFLASANQIQNGSTATTILMLGKRMYCANVGDSRTVISRKFVAMPLSRDHKPSREDEARRIREAGGFVINGRVMGELAVSRAFGDAEFKKGIKSIIEDEGVDMGGGASASAEEQKSWDQPLITAEPEIESLTLTDDDNFILLACDGLYDVFTNEEVVEFVKTDMIQHGDAQRCCQNLTNEAIKKRNSRDNVSVILVILNKWY